MDPDSSTRLLVAELLSADFREFAFAKEAEKLQLAELAIPFDCPEDNPPESLMEVDDDVQLILRLVAEDVHIASDAAYAQAVQQASNTDIVDNIASQQLAQKLAAVEKKVFIDGEFARKLQGLIDSGQEIDSLNDVESALGKEVVDKIIACDRNDKWKARGEQVESHEVRGDVSPLSGKGKGRAVVTEIEQDPQVHNICSDPYPICKMCLDPFQVTASPLVATLSANTSNRIAFGLRLSCPNSHAYCIGCLSNYIKSKLDPEGDGNVSHSVVVFPIPCPECSANDWYQGIDDDVAERVLGKDTLDQWYYRRIIDSLPKYYCPNPRCSTLVVIPEDPDEIQAICPFCQSLICVPCRSIWHPDISCEEYQSLPIDERSHEDRQALQLAKTQKWKRCPSCSMLVELTEGCNHITCRCRTNFCFRCGSLWDSRANRCITEPPCLLWDDETMLLNERDRELERLHRRLREEEPVEQPLTPTRHNYRNPPLLVGPQVEFDWMTDRAVICPKHLFTNGMAQSLTCGYCYASFISLEELQHHLANAGHSTFSCCGRFFKREIDLDRHQMSAGRFRGAHLHEFRRDLGTRI